MLLPSIMGRTPGQGPGGHFYASPRERIVHPPLISYPTTGTTKALFASLQGLFIPHVFPGINWSFLYRDISPKKKLVNIVIISLACSHMGYEIIKYAHYEPHAHAHYEPQICALWTIFLLRWWRSPWSLTPGLTPGRGFGSLRTPANRPTMGPPEIWRLPHTWPHTGSSLNA